MIPRRIAGKIANSRGLKPYYCYLSFDSCCSAVTIPPPINDPALDDSIAFLLSMELV